MTPHLRRSRLLVAVFSLALLAACEKDTEDDTSNTPIAAEKFSEEYAQALCTRSAQCGGLAPYLADQCKADANERIHPEDVQKAVAAGRLVYDAAKARQCINGILSNPCLVEDLTDEVQATCYAALQGTVQKGAACSFLFECAASTCGGTGENTCPATCPEEVLGEGESCSRIRGPKCDTRAGLRCSGDMCIKPLGQGADCIDNFGCKSGFVCAQDTNTCVPLGKEGAGCSEDPSCAEGFYCQDNTCTARKNEGQPCSVGPEEIDPALRGAQCKDGLICKGGGLDFEGNPFAGTCRKPSAEGGSCQAPPETAQNYLTGCLNGLSCVGGTCALPPVSGTCPESDSCRPGAAYCDTESNTCQLLRANGEACKIPPECASRNCVEGTCMPNKNYCHE